MSFSFSSSIYSVTLDDVLSSPTDSAFRLFEAEFLRIARLSGSFSDEYTLRLDDIDSTSGFLNRRIDFGGGVDSLFVNLGVDGSPFALDLTESSNFESLGNLEIIDASGGNVDITLDADSIESITSITNLLTIKGDGSTRVDFGGDFYTIITGSAVPAGFVRYSSAGSQVDIQDGVVVLNLFASTTGDSDDNAFEGSAISDIF